MQGSKVQITYSLIDADPELFTVNATSGHLLLLTPLDYESTKEHKFLVQAMDNGSPRLTSTAQVIIIIVDVNDNAPTFTEPYYRTKIFENASIGTNLLIIKATDLDSGLNGRIG